MKKTITTIALFCICSALFAQSEQGVGFSSWLKNPINEFNETNTKNLQIKVDQIIARNGAGSTSALSMLFVIYPEIIITRSDVIESGLKPLYVVRGELSLFAVNKADLSNYGSVVLSIEGNGNNEQDAIRAMLNKVQPTNPVFTRFIRNAQAKVVEYFTAQTPAILAKAKSLADRHQYDDALVLLSMIPECMDNYPMIAEQMSQIYLNLQDKVATTAIQEAKSKIALRDYPLALDVLLHVDPTSKYSKEAFDLIEQVKQVIDTREEQAIADRWKMYEDKRDAAQRAQNSDTELKKLHIEAAKGVANAYAKAEIQKAESSGLGGLQTWFFGKLK